MLLTPLHNPAPITEHERLSWLRLARTDNVGPITFHQLLQAFGSAQKALEALPELSRRGGRKKPLSAPAQGDIEREYIALRKLGGEIITALDSVYPIALSELDDAPPVLSILGNPELMNRSCVAIVGARNASLNGRKLAQSLAHELGRNEHVIVSGLARGIDSAAHAGSLSSGTIAVVAGGVDVIYPEENTDLYYKIRQEGLIIAEGPLGQKPFAASFPRRNRIVSGLSSGVIVVEATLRSGSLITARLAAEQGRDVYAVPGSPLDPRASGPNHLIREGATLIRHAQDVIESLQNFSGTALRERPAVPTYFDSFFPALDKIPDNSPESAQEDILSLLSFTPIHIDELLRACHLTLQTLQTALLELELAGRIRRMPGNRIVLMDI